MKKRTIIILLACVVMLGACRSENREDGGVSYRTMTMEEAQTAFSEEGNYVILDVRRPDEFESGHIPHAINVPNEMIGEDDISELPKKDQLIYVYCRSGRRSVEAAEKLAALGYTNVVEIGGIWDWNGEVIGAEEETSAAAVSEETYEDAALLIGAEAARQIRVMAENYEVWVMQDYAPVGGEYAVFDLDCDGRLELMTTCVQGTGFYSYSSFYQVNEENTELVELEQTPGVEGDMSDLPYEIGVWGYEKQGKAYIEENGRVLYAAADYTRAGYWSSGNVEGCYYLENGAICDLIIRGERRDVDENEEVHYIYFAPDSDAEISKEAWEALYADFLKGKQKVDVHIEWKSLYEEEGEALSAEEWFTLLTDSYQNAVLAK